MKRLALALCIVGLSACSKNNAPAFEEKSAPEAVIDSDVAVVGMAEPRVTVVENAELTLPPPAFSAKGEILFFPDSTRKISEVRELMLRLKLKGIPRTGELTVELSQPDGEIYEARSVRVGDSPYQTYAAEFVFPVAGASIDRASMSGTWTARYFLDGEQVAAGSFELEQ